MTQNGHAYEPRRTRKQEQTLRPIHRRTAEEAKLHSPTLVYLDPVDMAQRAVEEGRRETLQLLARIRRSSGSPKALAAIREELRSDLKRGEPDDPDEVEQTSRHAPPRR